MCNSQLMELLQDCLAIFEILNGGKCGCYRLQQVADSPATILRHVSEELRRHPCVSGQLTDPIVVCQHGVAMIPRVLVHQYPWDCYLDRPGRCT